MKLKLAFALLVGFISSLYVLQHNCWIKQQAGLFFKQAFQQALKCTVDCTVEQVQFFPPRLVLRDFAVVPTDGLSCHWRAGRATVGFSWVHFLQYGMVDLALAFDDLEVHTDITGIEPAMINHLANFAQAPPLDVALYIASCIVRGGRCNWRYADAQAEGFFSFNGSARQVAQKFIIDIAVLGGDASCGQRSMMHGCIGGGQLQLWSERDKLFTQLALDATIQVPLLQREQSRHQVRCLWHGREGSLAMRNHDGTVQVDVGLSCYPHTTTVAINRLQMPVAALYAAVINQQHTSLDGVLQAQGRLMMSEGVFSGEGSCSCSLDSAWGVLTDTSCTVTCTMSDDRLIGDVVVKKGNEQLVKTSGECIMTPCGGALSGVWGEYYYNLHGVYSNELVITGGVHDAVGRVFASCCGSSQAFHVDIQMPIIKELLSIVEVDVQGEGTLSCGVEWHDDQLKGSIAFTDGLLRIPHLHNFIQSGSCIFSADMQRKKLLLEEMMLQLHRGKLLSKHAVIFFDDQAEVAFAQVPLSLQHCMLNPHKDLFAIISGNFILARSSSDHPWNMQGALYLEQGQIADITYAPSVASEIPAWLANTQCNLTCATCKPVRIATPFIHAQTHLQGSLRGTFEQPEIAARATITQGALLFPHTSLRIVRGSVQLLPHRMHDPLIDLVARETIKRRMITMHVAGSAQQPTVTFDASPMLSEQQIISLLLTGTEQESFTGILPSLLVQKIAASLCGNERAPFSFATYGIKPPSLLQQISVVPSVVTSQHTHELKGALDIALSDRWRAVIQQSLTDKNDRQIEVEYDVSDEVAVRALSNEWSDIGAEVEFKWKF